MTIAIIAGLSKCNFAINFADVSAKEKVKECMQKGLTAWFLAANPEALDEWNDDAWTKEEIENFYQAGYSEPTCELLNRYSIKHECIDVEFDKDDNVINADEVIYY